MDKKTLIEGYFRFRDYISDELLDYIAICRRECPVIANKDQIIRILNYVMDKFDIACAEFIEKEEENNE